MASRAQCVSMCSIFSDRDRNSEVCAQALLPKLGCFNNDDDEAHLQAKSFRSK